MINKLKLILLFLTLLNHQRTKSQSLNLIGVYKSDSADIFYTEVPVPVKTILILDIESNYYEIKYGLDFITEINRGTWKLKFDTLILTGNDTIKFCNIDVSCNKSGNNDGLKLLLRTSEGKPIQGKIRINSTKQIKANQQGEIYYSKIEFEKILTSLSKSTFRNFSSIDYEFKKYKGAMTSDFDENCNELQLTFDINPNIMPPKFRIQKWKVEECSLHYLNDDKWHYTHPLSKEDCK